MALWDDRLIIAIIKRFLNLRCIDISCNDIGDEVIEALAHTYHKLEYLDLDCCGFVNEPSIYNVIHSCPKLQHLNLSYYNITTIDAQRHKAGKRILVPEWWYSTDLTNLDQ
ncbi:hypothetical protein C1645_824460 [Glomus cerebriforme]|uniref:F-box domain-containing protein n=1 Tax=Glomus cerebriforme TaxID=658196 RepID=A0A397T0C8_9GLOM|nr:hypothetical protein C1645_824460 [Glomus cerebriforme]